MTRRDVTDTQTESFEALSAELVASGFDVHHFHGVDVDTTGEEHVVHISPDGENSQWDKIVTPGGWHSLVADEWH